MDNRSMFFLFCIIFGAIPQINGGDLTFYMLEHERLCFFEKVDDNSTVVLYFKVMDGGDLDIDVTVQDPEKYYPYRKKKINSDRQLFYSYLNGSYEICFSNQFASKDDKLVYLSLFVYEESPSYRQTEHSSVRTEVTTSLMSMSKKLDGIMKDLTHHGLYKIADHVHSYRLNKKIFRWSCQESLMIVAIGIVQVYILRKFFSDKKTDQNFLKL